MIKFPKNSITVDIEALGGATTLTELTLEYRVLCNEDTTYDSPMNGLQDAGLTKEQVLKLGENTSIAVYKAVVDLTYPNARAELERMIADGTYKPPTKEQEKKAKKNS